MLREFRVYKFYEQVKQEAYKVLWPSRKELVTSTGVVLAVVLVVSILCLLLDYCIHNLVQLLLNIGK